MIDHGRLCDKCGGRTMTHRFAIGLAVDAVNLCLTCVKEAEEELVEHGATVKTADIGGES